MNYHLALVESMARDLDLVLSVDANGTYYLKTQAGDLYYASTDHEQMYHDIQTLHTMTLGLGRFTVTW